MTNLRSILLASAAALALSTPALAADQVLSGAIASASGEKLGGVTVSAKLEGSTITHQRLHRRAGQLLLPAAGGRQIQGVGAGARLRDRKSEVDLSGREAAEPRARAMTDPERRWRQLPGEMMVAALPEETADDARIKKIFTNQCTGCHAPSYVLQFRFDEDGWNKIIDLMKVVANTGVVSDRKPNQIIDLNQKELAAYLAKVRGPGESPLKVKDRPRPSGEAARVTWTLYDVPLNPDVGIGTSAPVNDGSDWSLGTHLQARPRSPMTAAWISTATSGSPRTRPTSTSPSAASTPRPASTSRSR